jgi:hypothetical protein
VSAIGVARRACGSLPPAPASWPLYAVLVSYPLWWALGAAYLIWPALTFPLLLSLLLRRNLRFPPAFGVWVLFLAWMLLSALKLHGFSFSFVWRASIYGSATVLYLYVFNSPRRLLSDRTVLWALTVFWLELVVSGYLGVLFPYVSFHAPLGSLLPGSFSREGVLQAMLNPGFAEVMHFLGYPVGRPKTLFAYSNHWGSCIAVLTPFAILAFTQMPRGPRRRALGLALFLSLVPIVVSLDRGVWVALVVGLGYGALRSARVSSPRALIAGIAALLVGTAAIVATPLGSLAQDRVKTDSQSTTTRITVYQQTRDAALQSPLLGYGSPKATSRAAASGPPAGTQGQIPLLVYSHGLPGLAFFLAFFVVSLIRTARRRSPTSFAVHVALLIALVEMPFYSFMPTTLHVLMIGAALAWRDIAFAPETVARAQVLRSRRPGAVVSRRQTSPPVVPGSAT